MQIVRSDCLTRPSGGAHFTFRNPELFTIVIIGAEYLLRSLLIVQPGCHRNHMSIKVTGALIVPTQQKQKTSLSRQESGTEPQSEQQPQTGGGIGRPGDIHQFASGLIWWVLSGGHNTAWT